MRLVVCGGRDFGDWRMMEAVLSNFGGAVELAHGGARGADVMSGDYARRRGWPVTVYEADWKAHGRGAGPRRNQRMLDDFHPDLVIAFPGGKGTADMVARCRRQGVEVTVVDPVG